MAEALRVGYRLIDTAASYFNEREVGEGIRVSGLDRSEVFVEAKFWISDHGYDQALHAFDKTVGAYKALEKLHADGKVRAIGVSNSMPEVLSRLLSETEIVPTVNQVEVHPYFSQLDVQDADAEHGILTQAWSPIGGITSYGGNSDRSTFNDPVIGKIADRHGRTPAQIMLRRHLQQGRAAIPKSAPLWPVAAIPPCSTPKFLFSR